MRVGGITSMLHFRGGDDLGVQRKGWEKSMNALTRELDSGLAPPPALPFDGGKTDGVYARIVAQNTVEAYKGYFQTKGGNMKLVDELQNVHDDLNELMSPTVKDVNQALQKANALVEELRGEKQTPANIPLIPT
ncbi:MAG: hypothetical protein H7A36_04910 [Chlamydiales bacterium]|nr:hypothetical protein [Chlamydiales bacterium]